MTADSVIFLVDVDETLLHTDAFDRDLGDELEGRFGAECRDRYRAIEKGLFAALGYRDYLEAFQRYRFENPEDQRLRSMSSYVLDYPFAKRLYPGALDVLRRLRGWGQTVILTDGDIILQPRKVEQTGIATAVDDHVLLYIHKEKNIPDIERRYPAKHYVLVDDKLRILTAFKRAWSERVTTVFPRQGSYANDPALLAKYPPADVTVEKISHLLDFNLEGLLAAATGPPELLTTA